MKCMVIIFVEDVCLYVEKNKYDKRKWHHGGNKPCHGKHMRATGALLGPKFY